MTTLNTTRFAAHANQAQFGLNRKVILKQLIDSAARPINWAVRVAKEERAVSGFLREEQRFLKLCQVELLSIPGRLDQFFLGLNEKFVNSGVKKLLGKKGLSH
ncbi:MAG: hypothetical protein U0003_03995 [Vampirovibrionales bacterium]